MFLIRKSPFIGNEDPTQHMVSLLAKEAESSGKPFSDDERSILSRQASASQPISEELRLRASRLIERLLEREQNSEAGEDPKSFNNSLEWAGDPGYPNIVALTEDVVCSQGFRMRRPPSGREKVKDAMQLIGCAVSIVLFMFLVVGVFSLMFGGK